VTTAGKAQKAADYVLGVSAADEAELAAEDLCLEPFNTVSY
jgi:hypothetical protein